MKVSAGMRALAIAGAIFVGALTVIQSRINGRLGALIDDGIFAAWISFSVGLVAIVILVAVVPSQREALRRLRASVRPGSEERAKSRWAAGAIRPWYLLAGIGGATFVAAQSTTVQYLGVAMFTVGVVTSQNIGSLFVDRLGMGPRGVQPITVRRVFAALLAIVGVMVAVSGQAGTGSFQLWAVVFVFIAGLLIAIQQALNGRVAESAGSAWIAGLCNFIAGWAALSIALVVSELFRHRSIPLPPSPLEEPVLWLGGFIGLAFIVVAAIVVRVVGVLVFALLSITGQLACALLLDLFVPEAGVTLSRGLIVGVVLTASAVVIATSKPRQEYAQTKDLDRS